MQNLLTIIKLISAGLLINVVAFNFGMSQKGQPPKEKTTATVHTNFPQHEDFNPGMLAKLKVSEPFSVHIAATGLGKPRMLAFDKGGRLYITRRDQGDVLQMIDSNRDGRFETMHTVVSQFPGVHGIAIKDDVIYLCSNRELKRGKISQEGDISDLELLMKDLPDGGQHGNRTMAFGPDGMLYMTIGSDCNDCNESNPEHATIVVIGPDGKQRRIFARGLRNTIGIDWHPETKELWGADNGTDWRGDDTPPEELNRIVDGGHYGWPLIYGDRIPDETREEPVGSTKKEFALTTESPALVFPAHAAPINLMFLDGTKNFPAEYRSDALITLHGSWNKMKPDGYKVVRVKFQNGKPTASEDFLSGFLSADGKSRFGRPAGLATSPAGDIYISDDESGIIYSVTSKSKATTKSSGQ